MIETIRAVYERYGFEPVETPAIEYTDALGKFLPDQDRPNEGVFSFQDDDEQWLSLRYDLTAPLARYVAENFERSAQALSQLSRRLGLPQREAGPGPLPPVHAVRCRHGRRRSPGRRCRDVHDGRRHDGGARHPARPYVVKVNNRKVLDGVMEAIGLGGEANAGKRLTVLRAIDKLDRLGVEGVRSCSVKDARTKAATSPKVPDLNELADLIACLNVLRAGMQETWRPDKRLDANRHCRRISNLPPRTIELREAASLNCSKFEACAGCGYDDDRIRDRSLCRPRPRILHRPGLRS